MKPRVYVVLTCHNRRAKTLACLRTIYANQSSDFSLSVILVDAGSQDSTSEVVACEFPLVEILHGSDSLFWASGMRLGLSHAIQRGDADFYIWLNDDVELDGDALRRALEFTEAWCAGTGRWAVFIGSLKDKLSGEQTYGGVRRLSRWRPLLFGLIEPSANPVSADSFNGNFVVLPRTVVEKVGNIDENFTHAFADYDYGFRVKVAGFDTLVLPFYIGTCTRNPIPNRSEIVSMNFLQRWHRMTGPKLYPPADWLLYTRRHTGPLWLLFFFRPYIEVVFGRLFRRLR